MFDAARNLTQEFPAAPASQGHRRRCCARVIYPLMLLLLTPLAAAAATAITSVRVWPAQDYTRVTFESTTPITHQLLLLKNPDRLALDLVLAHGERRQFTPLQKLEPRLKSVHAVDLSPAVQSSANHRSAPLMAGYGITRARSDC